MQLNICIVGEWLGGQSDEGFRNFGKNLIKSLGSKARVTTHIPETRSLLDKIRFDKQTRLTLAKIKPDHVIYISPSNATFAALLRLKFLKRLLKSSRTWILSMQADQYGWAESAMMRLILPDGVITQSPKTINFFEKLKVPSFFVPSGVDLNKFSPVDLHIKQSLRQKYSVRNDAFTLLHVGHLNTSRNIKLLGEIAESSDIQVIVAASTSTPQDQALAEDLKRSGVRVFNEYLPRIEEIYQLADAYLFPVNLESAAINVPLSVLEALSCNIPVISTRFGGLPDMFPGQEGVFFYENRDQLMTALKLVQTEKKRDVRFLVEKYSWEQVADNILRFIQKDTESNP